MIKELPANINLDEIREEWIKIGLSTEEDDVENAEKGVDLAYQAVDLEPPKLKVWKNSPVEGIMYVLNMKAREKLGEYASEEDIKKQISEDFNTEFNNFCYGQHEASWLSFYWVFKDLIPETKKLEGLWLIARSTGWWLPYKDMVVLTRRPIELHRNKDNQLHKDGGPALLYKDGFCLYRLNGVKVPKWLAETRAENINPIEFTKLDNVEVRREFVRKVGMERIVYKLQPAVIEKDGDYELLNFKLGDETERLYLKMKNPSIGTWHVEGILPGIRTIREALNWRNGLTEDMIDDVNGAEWFQQGDVIIRPKGPKKFRSKPSILT